MTMKISTILDRVDSSQISLPKFQRSYVWKREQVRSLLDSLYHGHPVGSLLIWETSSSTADFRGSNTPPPGVVQLLLDGQQRVTTLYGIARGRSPGFFDGDEKTFTGLMFHVGTERFEFYQALRMRDDPLWVNVTEVMSAGPDYLNHVDLPPNETLQLSEIYGRLSRLLAIRDIELHMEIMASADLNLDVVVDIFNRVNSGGTKLSKGDLALAKICAGWPNAREEMQAVLAEWSKRDYHFDLVWLLRSINAILTGRADFRYLSEKSPEEIRDGLERAVRSINAIIPLIDGRLGLDHDRVFFARQAVPVMARFYDRYNKSPDAGEQGKLLYYYAQAGMWGRYSGNSETSLEQDLATLDSDMGSPLESLVERVSLWNRPTVEPRHFAEGLGLGARFYPVLYMLTRMSDAKDLRTGLPLKQGNIGRMNQLEVHHIFPKSLLYEFGYSRAQVNALGNFCFLTKDSNLQISNRQPSEYLEEVAAAHPGALESQWIPTDRALWHLESYPRFLEERLKLMAAQTNIVMSTLIGRSAPTSIVETQESPPGETVGVLGGIAGPEEENELLELNGWVDSLGLSHGEMGFDYADPETESPLAVFDLAWPNGLQDGLSQPVAVLLDEGIETLAIAASAGYRCFTSVDGFKHYVIREIVGDDWDQGS